MFGLLLCGGATLSVRRGQLGVLGVEGEALAEVVLHGPVHVFDHSLQVVPFVGVRLKQIDNFDEEKEILKGTSSCKNFNLISSSTEVMSYHFC